MSKNIFDILDEPTPRSVAQPQAETSFCCAAYINHNGWCSACGNNEPIDADSTDPAVDLGWRPWRGQVKRVASWDPYVTAAENIARASSSPNLVRASCGLPLSSDRGSPIACPCSRCVAARMEVIAVCHAHDAREQGRLDTPYEQKPGRSLDAVTVAAGVFIVLWFGHILIVAIGGHLFPH